MPDGSIPRNPFVDAGVPSLQDILERAQRDPDLDPVRRRDVCSAIRVLADWFGLHRTALPASKPFLREKFARFHPTQVGVGKKRLANVRSAVNFTLDRYGGNNGQHYFAPLTPAWRRLWDLLPGKYEQCALSRFLRYLSARGILPDAVDDQLSEDFRTALEQESLIKDPREAHKNMARAWNRMAERNAEWPQIRLTEPRYREPWGLPLSAFPPSFEADVDAFLTCRSSDDLFAEDGPDRPLRPRTVKTQKDHFRCFASALIQRGHTPAAITSPAYLVVPAHYRDGLLFWFERDGGSSPYLASIAFSIRKYAKYGTKLPESEMAQVEHAYRRICGAIEPRRSKSAERLRQFDDLAACRRFLAYPTRKIETIRRRDTGGIREALEVQWAVATELWLFVPARLENFVTMRLDGHLFWPNGSRPGPLRIAFASHEVKNREDLEFEVPAEVAAHVRLYIETYRPRFVKGASPWLWPGMNGGPKHVVTFRHQVCRAVWEETGLKINPHLMRRIGPKLFLEIRPEMKEIVRHVLGHRSMRSTSLYTGAERRAALRVYEEEILRQRRMALGQESER